MNFEYENDSDFEDKEFENLALLLAYPRRQGIFRHRTDHFTW